MRHLCVFVLALFLSVQLWGQESSISDKITLITGEVYIGDIVVKTADMVMIKTKNGTRYQFPLSEVRQIVKVQVDGKTQTSEIQLPVSSDFCGQLEVSGGISNAKYVFGYSPNIQATVAFGNKQLFGKNLFLGVGVGYNNTFIGSNSAVLGLLPVFCIIGGCSKGIQDFI